MIPLFKAFNTTSKVTVCGYVGIYIPGANVTKPGSNWSRLQSPPTFEKFLGFQVSQILSKLNFTASLKFQQTGSST